MVSAHSLSPFQSVLSAVHAAECPIHLSRQDLRGKQLILLAEKSLNSDLTGFSIQ